MPIRVHRAGHGVQRGPSLNALAGDGEQITVLIRLEITRPRIERVSRGVFQDKKAIALDGPVQQPRTGLDGSLGELADGQRLARAEPDLRGAARPQRLADQVVVAFSAESAVEKEVNI